MDSAKTDAAPRARREPNPVTRQPQRPRPGLPAIVGRIREDARQDPGDYLEESEVPAGGE